MNMNVIKFLISTQKNSGGKKLKVPMTLILYTKQLRNEKEKLYPARSAQKKFFIMSFSSRVLESHYNLDCPTIFPLDFLTCFILKFSYILSFQKHLPIPPLGFPFFHCNFLFLYMYAKRLGFVLDLKEPRNSLRSNTLTCRPKQWTLKSSYLEVFTSLVPACRLTT